MFLNPRQQLLISKVIKEKQRKEAALAVGVGSFKESLTLKVAGSIRVGAPTTQAVALKFPWQRLALMLATRVSRQTLDAVLREVRTEEAPGDLKDHVLGMWSSINDSVRKEVAGAVTGKTSVEILQQ